MAEVILNDAAESTTAPQESVAADNETTSATEQMTATEASTAAETATDTEEGTTPSEAGAEDTALDEIEYRFNHETKKVARKDAPALIQKLLKSQYDHEQKNTPRLDRLRFLAEASGKDLDGLIDDLEKSFENSEYQRFLKETGGNEKIARELAEMSKKRASEKFRTTAQLRAEEEEQAKESLTARMGDELADLQAEFPEITQFSDLPESVVADAGEKNISLLDSYLRYLHRNAKRAAAQKTKQEKTAATTTGSLRGAPDTAEKADAQSAAFAAAFRKNL